MVCRVSITNHVVVVMVKTIDGTAKDEMASQTTFQTAENQAVHQIEAGHDGQQDYEQHQRQEAEK